MVSPIGLVSFITSSLNAQHGHVVMEIVAARYLIIRLIHELSNKTDSDLTHLSKLSADAFNCLVTRRGISAEQIVRAESEFKALADMGFIRPDKPQDFREF